MNEKYKELLEKKLCVQCKINKSRPSRTLCQECADKQKQRDVKKKTRNKYVKCFGCKEWVLSTESKEIITKNKLRLLCPKCFNTCNSRNCYRCYDDSYNGFISECMHYEGHRKEKIKHDCN